MPQSSEKPKITSKMIKEAYEAAKRYYDEKSTRKDAINSLVRRTGMNPSSAGYYVNGFMKMMNGEKYTGTMNEEGTDYFLTRILSDYGEEKLQNAIMATNAHLDYYSQKGKGSLNGIQEIVKKHSAILEPLKNSIPSDGAELPFFNIEEIEFLKKWAGEKYEKDNKEHVAAKDVLMNTVWLKTQFWSNEVVKRLADYEVSNPRMWSKPGYQGSYFKDYAWARIFKKGDKNKDIFFTVSVSTKDHKEALVYKLDYHHAKDSKLTQEQQALCNQYIPTDIRWREIHKNEILNWNWDLLINEMVEFVSENDHHYDQVIQLVFEKKKSEVVFKNNLTKRDFPEPPPARGERNPSFKGVDVDFEAQTKENKKLGDLGEALVKRYEENKLRQKGLSSLADRVEIVKDGRGFDVLSFDENGAEIHIEVKTTSGNEKTPFLISRNEVMFFKKNPQNYFIYRLYNYEQKNNYADFFIVDNPSEQLHLEPTTFEARTRAKKDRP